MNVETLTSANTIELYISPTCPYCAEARAFYDARKIPYTAHDTQNDPALRKRMFAYTSDVATVPAIVVDGKYVQSGWGKPPRG